MSIASCDAAALGRVLIVPGLHDSPPEHWQSWLQRLHRDAVRVTQRDWATPDLDRWAARIGSTIARAGPGPWIAVAHSFGALALLRHLVLEPRSPVAAALLVAPADPDRFGVGESMPRGDLGRPATVVLSRTDPWLSLVAGRRWAQRWGTPVVDLGQAGHVNVAAGFSTLPLAQHWVTVQQQHLARLERPARAAFAEWSFAV